MIAVAASLGLFFQHFPSFFFQVSAANIQYLQIFSFRFIIVLHFNYNSRNFLHLLFMSFYIVFLRCILDCLDRLFNKYIYYISINYILLDF